MAYRSYSLIMEDGTKVPVLSPDCIAKSVKDLYQQKKWDAVRIQDNEGIIDFAVSKGEIVQPQEMTPEKQLAWEKLSE